MNGPSEASLLARELIGGVFDNDAVLRELTSMAARGDSIDEVRDMAMAFRDAAILVCTKHAAVADLCGTGGAPFRTFNISTAASFIVSAIGVPVAKHGNRSNRGPCGSADVIEALGANVAIPPENASKMLDELGMVFLFAQMYNPAMKNVALIRKSIKERTVFNMLGPLLNPVEAKRRQLLGVYDMRLLDTIPYVLASLGTDRAMVVHGAPGMDEVSIIGPTYVAELSNGSVDRYVIEPQDFGIRPCQPSEIKDIPPNESANVVREVLSGKEGPRKKDIVVLNAASALYMFGKAPSIDKGISMADEAISSGRASDQLQMFIRMSRTGILS